MSENEILVSKGWPCEARPRAEVLREILDPNVAKNEHGWVAADEIERLQARVKELEAEVKSSVRLTPDVIDRLW